MTNILELSKDGGYIEERERVRSQGLFWILAQACVIPVGWRSGSRLTTTLVASKIDILFSFFSFFLFSSPSSTFQFGQV